MSKIPQKATDLARYGGSARSLILKNGKWDADDFFVKTFKKRLKEQGYPDAHSDALCNGVAQMFSYVNPEIRDSLINDILKEGLVIGLLRPYAFTDENLSIIEGAMKAAIKDTENKFVFSLDIKTRNPNPLKRAMKKISGP